MAQDEHMINNVIINMMLRNAYSLLDSEGGEWDDNPEYTRAIIELTAHNLGMGNLDHRDAVRERIRAQGEQRLTRPERTRSGGSMSEETQQIKISVHYVPEGLVDRPNLMYTPSIAKDWPTYHAQLVYNHYAADPASEGMTMEEWRKGNPRVGYARDRVRIDQLDVRPIRPGDFIVIRDTIFRRTDSGWTIQASPE